MIEFLSWVIVVMAFVNIYFVWHGGRLYLSVIPRSPILLALFWVKYSLWLMSVYFAIVAARSLAGVDPVLPFGGIGLGLVVIYVLLLPGFIHAQMLKFLGERRDQMIREYELAERLGRQR